jgi:hypothetical protein
MNHTEKFWIYELKVILCLYGIRISRPEIMDIYPIRSMALCSVKSYYSLEVDEWTRNCRCKSGHSTDH